MKVLLENSLILFFVYIVLLYNVNFKPLIIAVTYPNSSTYNVPLIET